MNDLTAIVDRLGAAVRMVHVEFCLNGCWKAFRPIASGAMPVRSGRQCAKRRSASSKNGLRSFRQLLVASTLGARSEYSTRVKPAEQVSASSMFRIGSLMPTGLEDW
jgi:hypothetical protein